MGDDAEEQAEDDTGFHSQWTNMRVDVPAKLDVKDRDNPRGNPRRKVFKIVLVALGLVDLPAAIAMIVLGALHYHKCSVIAPLFLVIGGCASVLLYPLFVLTFIYQCKEKLVCGHIIPLVFLIFKFGSYISGALIAWLFWDWKTCSHQLYYPAAVLAPICGLISIIQFFVISKL